MSDPYDITGALLALTHGSPPERALEVMRLSLMDWAACGLAGRSEAVACTLRAQMAGGGAATVIGGATAAPAQAALINGATSHALDYDDTHFAHIGHPSVAVVPAALAVAQETGAGLEDALRAALIGAEGSVRTGLWLGRGHYQVGYHQTATAGAFGATLAAAVLLGLDSTQTRAALGLASTMASGLKTQFGTMGKPLNAGLAARTGVEAAMLAAAGMTSAQDGLAGPLGFGATHHGAGDDVPLPPDGAWWMESVSHKFHACCHGLHATLEALADLRGIGPAQVAQVGIATHSRWLSVCNVAAPRTGLECKFSYAQVTAMALSGLDTAAIGSFSDACAADPGLRALRERVRVTADDTLSEMQARVHVTLNDGTTREVSHDLAAPLPPETRRARIAAKLRTLLGEGPAADLQGAVQAGDLAGLLILLSASAND